MFKPVSFPPSLSIRLLFLSWIFRFLMSPSFWPSFMDFIFLATSNWILFLSVFYFFFVKSLICFYWFCGPLTSGSPILSPANLDTFRHWQNFRIKCSWNVKAVFRDWLPCYNMPSVPLIQYEITDQCIRLGGAGIDCPIVQCVPCSQELQLHGCNINSICQVVKADKNTNDCLKLALRLLCQYSL